MKKTRKIIFLALMVITIIAMFLPVASFNDNSAAALTGDIEKQQGKVDSAQTQLQRWIDGGKKSEADIQKQRDKVAKEQGKLDELLAQQAAASGDSQNGLSYSLLPGKLPAELEIDMQVVNQYKTYQWNFEAYYACIWAAFGCLVLSAALVLLAGNREISVLYTLSSFVHLIGILLTGTSVNPARSLATALAAWIYNGTTDALAQVWMFIVAPLAGAALAAILYKFLNAEKKTADKE